MEQVEVYASQIKINEIERRALKNKNNKTLVIFTNDLISFYYTYAYYDGGDHSPYFIKGNTRYNICVDMDSIYYIVNVGRKRGDINLMDTAIEF